MALPGKGGKRQTVRRAGFTTAADAQREIDRLKARADRGVIVSDRLTLGEHLTAWIEARAATLRPATVRSYRGHIERIWTPALGHVRLDTLRAEQVSDVLSRVPGGDATRQRVKATVSAALQAAMRQGLVAVNVARHVELPSGASPAPLVWTAERETAWRVDVARHVGAGRSPHRARELAGRPAPSMVWRVDQLGAFLDHVAGDRLAVLWAVLAYCGLRRGEVCALRWSDLDLDGGTLTVRSALGVVDLHVIEGAPKSRAGGRTVALDAGTVAGLRAHRKRQAAEQLTLGEAWQGTTGRVFTRPDGSDLHPATDVSDRFGELVEQADLPPVRLHDLRHSAASAMLYAGVDLKVVQGVLGHSQLAVTADLYTSIYPEVSAAAAAATAAAIPRSGTALHISDTYPAEREA